ncbi:MAG: 7-cyano-7-deazaguanine synthase QueC [Candidatus Gastranaerophilales bacterium]|nr:7-cyano-7-deazaguanine synthase QueC [Candidatus Gastranaerophilales bacterium]
MNNAIVLLSGGLDSVVSLASIISEYSKILALTFDYGQKSFIPEKKAAENIAKYYSIEHKIISLDWLAKISTSTLNTNDDVPIIEKSSLDDYDVASKTSKSVWVPNRNGLFLNIAGCYADAFEYNSIIIGANLEESSTFKDNSKAFINSVNQLLKNSTNSNVQVVAPLIDKTKQQIVSMAIELNVPFEYIYSCYLNGDKHCGKCESCQRLKRALEQNNRLDLLNKIFS